MAKTDKNINYLINQNPELIDIVICNHVSTIDFLIVMAYLQKFNISGYNFVLKNEIIYTPGFGFIMYASQDIKLNRN
jgi:1-acyl-sn-glycerol-3-phosphate acyltransferase